MSVAGILKNGQPGAAGVRSAVGRVLSSALPPVALIALTAYFSMYAPAFLSPLNLTLLTGQAGILLLASAGATLVVLLGSIDLSVGSAALLGGVVAAMFSAQVTANPIAVVLASVLTGALMGLTNGVVFAYGKVPSMITTLGTLSLFQGTALTLSQGTSVAIGDLALQELATGQLIPGVQNVALIALLVLGIFLVLTRRTRFGLYVYAIGSGENVARLAGVPIRGVKTTVFVLSSGTASLAGLMLVLQLGAAGPSLGSTTLLDVMAAIVVGGTALSGGAGGVVRTLLGVLVLTVLSNGLNQMGAPDYTQMIIKGAVIVVAAVFAISAAQRRAVVK